MAHQVRWLQAKYFAKGGNVPPTRVVIHTAEVPAKPGAAHVVARYFANPGRQVSAHAAVDDAEVWRCVDDHDVAYHAPPNRRSLGIELAGYAHMTPAEWSTPFMQATLAGAAEQVRAWCNAYGIPRVWLSPADLQAGKHGICGHVDVSHAFGQTNHTDPGPNFPVNKFMSLLVPAPAPGPSPIGGLEVARIFADKSHQDSGQVIEAGGKLFILADGSDSAALQQAGDKLVEVTHDLFERIKSQAIG